MRFTLFRKLREPDSGAGAGAPAAAPAADAGAPPADSGSSSPAGDAGAASSAWPDPSVDFAAWEDRWSNASDAEREAYERGQAPKQDETDPDDPPGDGGEEDPAKPAASTDVAEDAEITEEQFNALPANVRKAIQDAQELGARYEEASPFLGAQEDIQAILKDPIVARRLAEMQHGITTPKWLEGEVNVDAILDHFLDNAGKALDASLDRDGAKESLAGLLKNLVGDVTRRVEIRGEFEKRQIQEAARRERVLSEGFNSLVGEFAQLKSDKPIDSPDHPIESFRKQLLDDIEAGEVTFEYAQKNMKKLFAGHSVGSVGDAVKAATKSVRTKFLSSLTTAARQSAITATGAARNAPPPPANKFGVDTGRFASDADYSRLTMARAEELAEKGDYGLMDFLGQIYDKR